MEAFIKVYLYRKDLFENTEAKAAFRAQYGYGLEPAKTFGQYRDNAEFLLSFVLIKAWTAGEPRYKATLGTLLPLMNCWKPSSQVLVFITGESTWITIRRLWKMVVS